jgi:uncharacterized protein YjiS (DUF1127 family)
MEMHSRESLYEIHGLSPERRRRRSRLTARVVARSLARRIAAFLTKVMRAIESELAIRRAMTELAEMDNRMLRDLGISRSEIQGLLRRPRVDVGPDDVPTVNAPLIAAEGHKEQKSVLPARSNEGRVSAETVGVRRSLGYAAHQIEFRVGAHAREMRHAVRQREE